MTSTSPAGILAPKVKLHETGILILLLLLAIVVMDQSLCLSCTFELPDASSRGDADLGGDCWLCLTLAQPAEPVLFPVELDSNEIQGRMATTVTDSFSPPVFHPPQPAVGS